MNFYNEDEKKDGAAGAPSFKKTSTFGRAPLFSRTTGGIMDRLKNLSRKDMAFVGIGLSVLVMAPVAEYMMSKPSADNLLTPGFGAREGSAAAPSGLYEPGINSLSQGSPDGSGEVITPLASRDPVSLILGSQPAQPAMPPPVTAPPVSNFRDSMKDVGREAFSAAAKSTGAPTPIPRMQAALRSFGSFFSGGEGTRTQGGLSGGKIIDDAKSASAKAAKRSMVGPVAMPGYKGVASNTPNSSSRGAFEKLRAAADKSAGNFNGGSAISSLDKAAADAPNIGSGGGGLGYGGDSDKTTKPSGSSTKYDHNRSGESLEEMLAKERAKKEQDWEFYKKYEIPKQIINAIVGAIGKTLAEVVENNLRGIFKLDPPAAKCWVPFICPDGGCGVYIEQAKKAGVQPVKYVCEYAGAIKVSTKVGKESATSAKDYCLCGTGKDPDYGKDATVGGGGDANTPPVNPQNPQQPQTDPGTQFSDDATKTFSKYDDALVAIMNNTKDIEKLLLDTKSDTEVKPKMESLGADFDNLDNVVKTDVQKTLVGLKVQAGDAVTEFGRLYNEKKSRYDVLKGKYDAYDAAIKKIEADIKAKKLETVTAAGSEGEQTDIAKTVTEIIATHGPEINTGMSGAEGLISASGRRYNALTKQLEVVNASIGSVVDAHGNAARGAKGALAAEGKFSDRLAAATGRDPVASSAQPATGQAKEAPATATGNPKQAAGEAPLKTAALKLRAIDDWKKMWEEKKFTSKTAGDKESGAWNAYEKTIASESPAEIAAPDNFVANAGRSAEIGAAAASGSTGLKKNIEGMLNGAEVHMTTAQSAIGKLVKPCVYFKDGRNCSSVRPAAANTEILMAQSMANGAYEKFNAADQDYARLQPEQKAVISSAHDSLKAAANDVEVKQTELDRLVKSKAPGDQIAKATDALASSSKEYTRVQAAYNASYDAAKRTLTGSQKSALADYQTVLACDDAVTGFVPHGSGECSKSLSTRVGTIGSSADRDYKLIMTNDPAGADAAGRLGNQRETACKWASKCLSNVPAGCR